MDPDTKEDFRGPGLRIFFLFLLVYHVVPWYWPLGGVETDSEQLSSRRTCLGGLGQLARGRSSPVAGRRSPVRAACHARGILYFSTGSEYDRVLKFFRGPELFNTVYTAGRSIYVMMF